MCSMQTRPEVMHTTQVKSLHERLFFPLPEFSLMKLGTFLVPMTCHLTL